MTTEPTNTPEPIDPVPGPVPSPVPSNDTQAAPADAAAATGTRGTATRWVIAAAAAVFVGVLTMSGLFGTPKPVVVEQPTASSDAPGATGTPTCKADSKANLNYTVKDMNGASVKLADYKGKVILVNFWATWCPPCKAELPALIELYDRYKDQGLVVLGISGDDDAETLRAFASEWKINYPMIVGRDETDLMDSYGPIYGYPISVIVGRDGSVCGKHVGPATKEEFEREIKALL
jgi:cytochrome c biogenesis protein CcmG/thiol:disulfide interchange protein DsbE